MHYSVLVIGDDVEKLLAPYDETYWRNPDGRWDWYMVGGRWSNELILRESGAEVDSARWGDIDWERMGARNVEQARERYATAMADPNESWRSIAHNVLPGETETDHVRRTTRFTTFAVVTPDGSWHDREWGADRTPDDEWRRVWQALCDEWCDDDTIVTVVDCHV